jgi:hypothetical protein
MYNGRKRLKYDSYLDEDGDLFIWIDESEGYRWYPKSLWDELWLKMGDGA